MLAFGPMVLFLGKFECHGVCGGAGSHNFFENRSQRVKKDFVSWPFSNNQETCFSLFSVPKSRPIEAPRIRLRKNKYRIHFYRRIKARRLSFGGLDFTKSGKFFEAWFRTKKQICVHDLKSGRKRRPKKKLSNTTGRRLRRDAVLGGATRSFQRKRMEDVEHDSDALLVDTTQPLQGITSDDRKRSVQEKQLEYSETFRNTLDSNQPLQRKSNGQENLDWSKPRVRRSAWSRKRHKRTFTFFDVSEWIEGSSRAMYFPGFLTVTNRRTGMFQHNMSGCSFGLLLSFLTWQSTEGPKSDRQVCESQNIPVK
jgi:hypothetical protein